MTDFDIESFIIKPDELSKPEQILVYSDYGQGKTTFAASAAKFAPTSPVLYLDLEGSTTGVTRDVPPENIDIVRPKNMPIPEGMTKEEGWIHNTDRILVAFLTGEMPREYKTIVIDPLNVYNDWCADHFEDDRFERDLPASEGRRGAVHPRRSPEDRRQRGGRLRLARIRFAGQGWTDARCGGTFVTGHRPEDWRVAHGGADVRVPDDWG